MSISFVLQPREELRSRGEECWKMAGSQLSGGEQRHHLRTCCGVGGCLQSTMLTKPAGLWHSSGPEQLGISALSYIYLLIKSSNLLPFPYLTISVSFLGCFPPPP